ncbi:uncharacterized protein LOC144061965 [Vanacampus margaritifer]
MSADSMSSYYENVVLDNAGKGAIIRGIPDGTVGGSGGAQAAEDMLAATIHLDHLSPNEVRNILKVLQPYDNNMKVVTKKELSASASLSSLESGLQDPSETLSGDFLKKSDLDISSEKHLFSSDSMTAKLQAAAGEFNGSLVNDLPNVNLTKPSADAGAELTLPSPGMLDADLDGTLATPDVSLAAPQLNNYSASLDIDKPQVKSGDLHYEAPHFTMPKFDVPALDGGLNLPTVNGETQGLDLPSPKVGINGTKMDLNGPRVDLNDSDVNFETPHADIDLSSDPFKRPFQKLKGPHLKLKKPKLPGAKADLDLDAGLSTPEVDLSVPKVEGGLHAPDIDVNLPNADLKGPHFNIQEPHLDGKFVWPHQKWKKAKLKGPKADLDLDTGLTTPDLDLSTPELGNGINAQVALPKAVLKSPSLDVEGPNLNIDTPSAKKSWHLNLKKPKLPDLKADTDVNLSVPSIDGHINGPNVDLNSPNVDVHSPDVGIEAPSVKSKFPTMKKPKFWLAGPKLRSPSVDLDTDVKASPKRASLHGLDLNLPDADVDASGKMKWHTLKKPKWTISGAKFHGPDVGTNVSTPDLSLAAPKVDGQLNADIDAVAPSGKFKWLKKPKFGTLKIPKSDIDGDIEVPDVDLRGSDLRADVDLSQKIDTADINIKGPNLDVHTPDNKLKLPKLKIPKHGTGNLKFPKLNWPKGEKPDLDIDADVKGPHLDLAPDLSLSAPKIDGGVAAPDVNLPTAHLNADLPDFPNADVGLPQLDISSPQIKSSGVDMNLPNADVKSPNLHLPDLNTKTTGLSLGNFRAPNMVTKMLNADLETPDARLNSHVPDAGIKMSAGDLKGPDAQLKTPILGLDSQLGDFTLPHYNLPNLDLSSPGVEVPSVHPSVQTGLDTLRANIGTGPNISVPSADLSGPKIKSNINGPQVDVEAPKVDAGLEKPKLPHFKVPKLSFSGSKTKTPSPKVSLDGEISPLEVSSPEMSTNSPEIAIRAGDSGSPKSKFKWPFKWGFKSHSLNIAENERNPDAVAPKFRVHSLPKHCIVDTKTETEDIFNLSKFDSEAKDYVVSKGIRLPVVNAPSRNGERIDIMERLKMAMEKAPSTNASPTEEKTVRLESLDASGEAGDATLVRGGTFKVEKSEFPSGFIELASSAEESDDNNKLSLGLSKMLVLDA